MDTVTMVEFQASNANSLPIPLSAVSKFAFAGFCLQEWTHGKDEAGDPF